MASTPWGETYSYTPTGTLAGLLATYGESGLTARLAMAAYALQPHERTASGYNDPSPGGNAAIASLGQQIRWLEYTDFAGMTGVGSYPSLLPASTTNPDWPTQGLFHGVYVKENAAALVGRTNDTLFIDFRGTNDLDVGLGASPDAGDWLFKDSHYALLADLVQTVSLYANVHSEITNVVVTGHSLGASMAQAYLLDTSRPELRSGITLSVYGYASPGYGVFPSEDPRMTNLWLDGDIIESGAYFQDNVGDQNEIFHNDGLFSSLALHDPTLYLRVVDALFAEGIDIAQFDGGNGLPDFDDFYFNVGLKPDASALLGQGNDVLSAGTLFGLFDAPSLMVGAGGADVLSGGTETDLLVGGLGLDVLNGGGGNDTIYGGRYGDTSDPFNNVFVGGTGNDLLYGGAAIDSMYGDDGLDTLNGGAGIDYLVGGYDLSADLLNGGADGDNLYGFGGIDTLNGDDGADGLYGGDGNDTLAGGAGLDFVMGEAGNDTMWGDVFGSVSELTNNTLVGVGGNDTMHGGAGIDSMYGDDGADLMNGNGGIDYMVGGYDLSSDTLNGGDGGDNLYAFGGGDLLNGDAGSDGLYGGDGNDTMNGGANDDFMMGENGNDTLDGGSGNDTLVGQVGSDVFKFTGAWGADAIQDFQLGTDRIDLSGAGVTSFSQLSFFNASGSTLVFSSTQPGNQIYILGIASSSLSAASFGL